LFWTAAPDKKLDAEAEHLAEMIRMPQLDAAMLDRMLFQQLKR